MKNDEMKAWNLIKQRCMEKAGALLAQDRLSADEALVMKVFLDAAVVSTEAVERLHYD